MKSYGESRDTNRLAAMDLENKPTDYSVNNIDRIQQRIQSILGKKWSMILLLSFLNIQIYLFTKLLN